MPCKCPSPDCTFTAPAAALPEHFRRDHNWNVVDNFVYGQLQKLAVPDPQSMVALVDEADGCVFVLFAFARGTDTVVSLVHMRASGDAPDHPFSCELWLPAGGNKEYEEMIWFKVTSIDGSRLPRKRKSCLAVPQQLLHESGDLMIRIDDRRP